MVHNVRLLTSGILYALGHNHNAVSFDEPRPWQAENGAFAVRPSVVPRSPVRPGRPPDGHMADSSRERTRA